MNMVDIIKKQRDGGKLAPEEIAYIVKGTADGSLPDYQLSALLMAIFYRGMDAENTALLTRYMADSGDIVDLSAIPGFKADKHSTGGVADTTSIILVPLVAACGIPVAKMSGRALGHTGGTIDKLDSLGLHMDLTPQEFIDTVREAGCAIISQSADIAPADKKLYALRDVTATVDSLPLIASSIMSKKIASGADGIVLDVKTGTGALMKTVEDSIELARSMVSIGQRNGLKTRALVTDMRQPLGRKIGNGFEVEDAIEVLQGKTKGRLRTLSIELGAHMLVIAGAANDLPEARKKLEAVLENGKALETLARMIEKQKGDPRVCEDTALIPHAAQQKEVVAQRAGYIADMRTEDIGYAAQMLGAGRMKLGDEIDLSVGIYMQARIGDKLEKGDVLAILHYNDENRTPGAEKALQDAMVWSESPAEKPPLIYETIENA